VGSIVTIYAQFSRNCGKLPTLPASYAPEYRALVSHGFTGAIGYLAPVILGQSIIVSTRNSRTIFSVSTLNSKILTRALIYHIQMNEGHSQNVVSFIVLALSSKRRLNY
jgi:hypothetical protein